MMLTGFSRYTCLLAPAGEDDPGPLMARSLAASRPIPALAPVPTFLLAPAGEDDLGSPAAQVSSWLQAYPGTCSCPYTLFPISNAYFQIGFCHERRSKLVILVFQMVIIVANVGR